MTKLLKIEHRNIIFYQELYQGSSDVNLENKLINFILIKMELYGVNLLEHLKLNKKTRSIKDENVIDICK